MKLLYKKLVKYLYKLYLTKGTKKRLHDYIRKEPAIIKNSISPSLIKEYSRLWQPLGVKPKHEWLYYYVYYNGSESKYYVPDDIYLLIIEPSMNRLAFYKGYNDKNIYDKYFAGFNMPVTLLRNMNGIYYDKEYNIIKRSDAEKLINKSHGEYFVKPSQ